MTMFPKCALWFFLASAAASAAGAGVTYYISPSGDDSNSGTSVADAWQTLTNVDAASFSPGDQILFEGGATFTGFFQVNSSGTESDPIVFGSYGAGRATLDAGTGTAIYGYNVDYVTVRDLIVRGDGADLNTADGLSFYHDTVDTKRRGITIDHCEVSGFGGHGISVGAWGGDAAYDTITVVNSVAHANRLNGILVGWAERIWLSENVYVGYSTAYGNLGDPSLATNSGSGIVIGNAASGIIEYCAAYDNGKRSTAPEGPVGIWAYYSKNVTIQHCLSYANKTNGPADGGGFDLDQSCQDCTVQYCFAYHNEGAGMLLIDTDGGEPSSGNVVRYNIFENNGSENAIGALHVFGKVRDNDIHNNVFMQSNEDVGNDDDTVGNNAPVLRFDATAGQSGNRFRNNIFIAEDGKKFIRNNAEGKATFDYNLWWTSGGPFSADWDGATYTSFSAFKAASLQEANGIFADPLLTAPGAGDDENISDPADLTGLTAYRVAQGVSPLIDAALDMNALGLDPGERDFQGATLPVDDGYDIGPLEYIGTYGQ